MTAMVTAARAGSAPTSNLTATQIKKSGYAMTRAARGVYAEKVTALVPKMKGSVDHWSMDLLVTSRRTTSERLRAAGKPQASARITPADVRIAAKEIEALLDRP